LLRRSLLAMTRRRGRRKIKGGHSRSALMKA
jgi:hypothetical protein